MTPAQLLRHDAEKLHHAMSRDRIIDTHGKVVGEHDYHYLSCERCKLERQAEAIENYYRDFVQA